MSTNIKIDQLVINEIKQKNLIQDILKEENIELNRDGFVKCPFHDEKTPSFKVYHDSNTYHCYGCGAGIKGNDLRLKNGTIVTDAGSDVIALYQNLKQVSFIDACLHLMNRSGIVAEVNDISPEVLQLKELVTTRNRSYYSALMQYEPALEYLYQRGITDDSIKHWRIGYVPNSDPQPSIRNRIAFPFIEDTLDHSKAKTIAMAYRKLSDYDDGPKYRNDSNSSIYHKSSNLYGFNFAKQSIYKLDSVFVVEGYIDTILCHQHGITNTVGLGGTAFTEEQILKLHKVTNNITLWYDSDEPGQQAMMKMAPILIEKGFNVFIVTPSNNLDPADIIALHKDNIDEYLHTHIVPFLDYIIEIEANVIGRQISKLKLEAYQKIYPIIDKIPHKHTKVWYENYFNSKFL